MSDDGMDMHPLLDDWIHERQTSTADAVDPNFHPDGNDAELVSLLRAQSRAQPMGMSDEEAHRVLARVRARMGTVRSNSFIQDLALVAAAVLVGMGLGVATSPASLPPPPPAAAATETSIKRVSFETLHQGKVVRFHLELKQAR